MNKAFVLFAVIATAVAMLVSAIWIDFPRIAKAICYVSNNIQTTKIITPFVARLDTLNIIDQQRVGRNEIVAEISIERVNSTGNIENQQAELALVKQRLASQELVTTNDTEITSVRLAQARLESLSLEISRVVQELSFAQQRLADAQRQLKRQQELVTEGFVSPEAVEIKRSDVLQQQMQVSALQRAQLSLSRDMAAQQEELKLIALRAKSQRALLSKDMANAQQEWNEHSSKKLQLTSPIDGIVTQISVSAGQTVRPDIPIATIVPLNTSPEVLLLIPSRSIGFIRVGQKVSVRYQAYPHEHYGRHYGVVKDIARVALPPQEVVQHIRVEEPVYTVRVSLPTDYLEFEGKRLALTPGMVVEADVELDRLKIYQWLLEPFYRLGARV